MTKSESVSELAAALVEARKAFRPIRRTHTVKVQTKTGGSYEFQYAPYEVLLASTDTALGDHGLAVVQDVFAGCVSTIIIHKSGQFYGSGGTKIIADEHSSRQDYGAALSYARRYDYSLTLNLCADDDTDGHSPSANGELQQIEHRQQAREQRDAGNRQQPVVATHVHFGKHKGKPITELEPRSLAWFVRNEEEARAAGKKRSDADTALYEGVKAEIEKRKGASSPPADDTDDRIPMHNGPKHEELASRLHFESITTEDFMSAMKEAKQLPEHAKSFGAMSEETAAKFVADLDGTVEVVRNWQARKAA